MKENGFGTAFILQYNFRRNVSTQNPNKPSRRKEEDGEVLIKIIEFQK